MCNADQQKEALRNVAYAADSTWTGDLCPYQKANMLLYMNARHVKAQTAQWTRLTPRTVRDRIPQSKLAQYASYAYDEARELSYSPMVVGYERKCDKFDRQDATEPWMLEEIDDLLMGFLRYSSSNTNEEYTAGTLPHETTCFMDVCKRCYQSPFLEANSFDQIALKFKIVSQSIKKIWDTKYFPFYYRPHPVAKTKNLLLFKSPASQLFSSAQEGTDSCTKKTEEEEEEENLPQIKALTKTFKEQNTWIFKKQSAKAWIEPPHKRLYSAVLQGSSTEQNAIANLRFPSAKKAETSTETAEVNCESQTNYPYRVNLQTTASVAAAPPITNVFAAPTNFINCQYFPPAGAFFGPRLYSSNVFTFRQTNYYPLVLPNTPAAASPYFFNYQRSAFPNYRPTVFPQRLMVPPPSRWVLQPQVKPTVNLLPSRPPTHTSGYHYRPARITRPPTKEDAMCQDMESIVTKTINAVLDEPEPFVEVPADELELQALEQYTCSNTNVFQELERQATEQYEASENWKSPPERPDGAGLGGRCSSVRSVRFRCAETILRLGCSRTVKTEVTELVLGRN